MQSRIIIVHGTQLRLRERLFGWSRNWYSPSSAFSRALSRGFPDAPTIVEFCWSGKNCHAVRIEAAEPLCALLVRDAVAHPAPQRRYVVAHSHGGNVALLALSNPECPAIDGLVLLATPLFRCSSGEWIYWSGKGLSSVRAPIWNLFSPQDWVQSSAARRFSGFPVELRSRMKRMPSVYLESDNAQIRSGAINWTRSKFTKSPAQYFQPLGPLAHSAMHSVRMGMLAARLLQGEPDFNHALSAAGLSEGPNEIEDTGRCAADDEDSR